MRRIFALVLIALLVGVGLVAVIESDPGYLLVAYGNYTLESSLWVVLLLFLLFTLVVYALISFCLLYQSDAAAERSSVDLGGPRIIKKNK